MSHHPYPTLTVLPVIATEGVENLWLPDRGQKRTRGLGSKGASCYVPGGVKSLDYGFTQLCIWITPLQLKKSVTMGKLPNFSNAIFSTLKYPTHGIVVVLIWNYVHKADGIEPGP